MAGDDQTSTAPTIDAVYVCCEAGYGRTGAPMMGPRLVKSLKWDGTSGRLWLSGRQEGCTRSFLVLLANNGLQSCATRVFRSCKAIRREEV